MELRADPFILRAVTDEDWVLEHQLSRDAEVVRWTSYPSELTQAEALARVTRQQERAQQGATQRYTIWDADSRVGTCGLGSWDQASPEAMYALLPAARGRGIAGRGAGRADRLGGHARQAAVTLVTVEGNAASAAVALRAGFSIVETFEDRHRDVATTLHRWRWRPLR